MTHDEIFETVNRVQLNDISCDWRLGKREKSWTADYHRERLHVFWSVSQKVWRSIIGVRTLVNSEDGTNGFPSRKSAQEAAEKEAIRLAQNALDKAKSTINFYL